MKNMHLQDLEIFEILKSHFKKQDGKNEKNKKERQTTSNNTKGSALVFGCFGGVLIRPASWRTLLPSCVLILCQQYITIVHANVIHKMIK
jgi:hypothetical protein